ncbi:MAG: sigma-70 family RNA polymerase sigma factor [Herpetosiphonaceae bacterium]|nr:sigma-70 family RNA polymerase sigma factor [Herpetosiphonaceae bacterium]
MARRETQDRAETRADDDQLIARVAAGDRSAFDALYERYASAVFGLALKVLREREAAEEAVQEVFWRVWKRAASFDRSRAFAPWLFGIAHNYCIDELRRRKVRPQVVYEDDEHPILSEIPGDADIGAEAVMAEQRGLVRAALDRLPPEQREALMLAYFSGLTQQEIATQLGNPLGTVKTRMRLGLQKLRTLLQGHQLVEE